MCDDHDEHEMEHPHADPAFDPVLTGVAQPSRRQVLAGGLAVVGAAGAGGGAFRSTGTAGAVTPASQLVGSPLVRAAMHVHASCSEGQGSWEAQFAQAAAIGTDVMYMTDHDFRALAFNYLPSLAQATMVTTTKGSLAQHLATKNGAVVRVLAESSSATAAASVTSSIQAKPTAWNRLRTHIAGQSLGVTFASARIGSGGTYEIVVTLSIHPAYGTRPAGQFQLHYRFGAIGTGSSLEGGGLIGVVKNPTPAPGARLTLNLSADVAALWPDMLAQDNAFYLLGLVANSPRKGSVVDVSASVDFVRTQNDQASLITAQQRIIDTYSPRHPNLTVYPSVEISRLLTHIIPYGVPQFWPAQSTIKTDNDYKPIAQQVHSNGGLVGLCHPFGATAGPLLSAPAQTTKRHDMFAKFLADDHLLTDLMEVGYTVRGQVSTQTHLDLWDTFSRQAIFITGNGANDDHNGVSWGSISNGFATGIWAPSTAQSALVAALASGRAYTYHAGKFKGAQIDMLVDGSVPMGKVSVSPVNQRSLAIQANGLPSGSFVDVVRGPVDFTGNDPGTAFIARLAASDFSGSGTASVAVNTSTSCFVRVQVRSSAGAIIGIGNPIWLLRTVPPGGIPAPRQP